MTPQELADAIRDRRAATQTGGWVSIAPDAEGRRFLVRLYSDGSMTAEFKDADGRYSGESVITPEAGYWTSDVQLVVVS